MADNDRIRPKFKEFELEGLSLRLLNRPQVKAPILNPADFDPAPLAEDVARLSRPSTPITPASVLGLLAKLFHAYIHPVTTDKSMSLEAITLSFDRFTNRRRGADSLEGRRQLRLELLRLGFALCMLADLPKSAAIVGDILDHKPDPAATGGEFTGLDIGAGTGVLMLAQKIMAARAGYETIRIVGLERNVDVAERTNMVMKKLGAGEVVVCDAARESSYAWLKDTPLSFVANETLPSQGRRLWKEDFVRICEALFAGAPQSLDNAAFFPEAVIALDRKSEKMELNPANRFNPPSSAPLRLLKVWGLKLRNGDITPLAELGREYVDHIPDPWRPLLSHRW